MDGGRVDAAGLNPLIAGAMMFQAGSHRAAGNAESQPPGHEQRTAYGSKSLPADVEAMLREALVHWPVYLKHSIDPRSGQVQVTMIDLASGQVIRKIPPDAVLHLEAALREAVGKLFNRQA